MTSKKKYLLLEDGTVVEGYAFGGDGESVGELVFTTGVVGYIETLTGPSYYGQIVLQTFPLIGNYGVTDDDYESKNITIGGLIVRDYNDSPSNFRYTKTLSELLEENKIPGISGIDTRKLAREIRNEGSQLGLITGMETMVEQRPYPATSLMTANLGGTCSVCISDSSRFIKSLTFQFSSSVIPIIT